MKRVSLMAIALLVSALLSAPTQASVKKPTENPAQGTDPKMNAGSKVPKAQIYTVNKRREAKKQRDEKLKVRAKNVK